MSFKIEAACGCFVGNGRNNNEDNFYFNKKHLPKNNKGLRTPLKYKGTTDDCPFFAVFDGMGGEAKGEEAACIASEVFADELKKLDELVIPGKELFNSACQRANKAVCDFSDKKQIGTMGTTVAALYFPQDEVFVGNMGDSKVFRIRSNQMTQVSEDHTDEKILSSMGIAKKPVLLQYIGVPDTEMAIEPFVSKGDILIGDTYIICSDGVSDVLEPSDLYEFIKLYSKPEDVVKYALAEVDKRDGADNATLIVVEIVG